jgi:hypothetical protein
MAQGHGFAIDDPTFVSSAGQVRKLDMMAHLTLVRGKSYVYLLQGLNESAHLVLAELVEQVVWTSW